MRLYTKQKITSMKTFLTIVLLAFSISFSACKSGANKTEEIAEVYTCPMHPEVQSEEPGECPQCGMALVKENENEHPDSSSNVDDEIK